MCVRRNLSSTDRQGPEREECGVSQPSRRGRVALVLMQGQGYNGQQGYQQGYPQNGRQGNQQYYQQPYGQQMPPQYMQQQYGAPPGGGRSSGPTAAR